MIKYKKAILITLIILNTVVLLGQLWPEGAPPFAKTVNVLTLILNIGFIIGLLSKKI